MNYNAATKVSIQNFYIKSATPLNLFFVGVATDLCREKYEVKL